MPSNTIKYSSDVARRLTKGYGSTTQPIYVKSDGTIDTCTGQGSSSTWATARTFTVGNTGKSVDGSADVAWSLSEIGAAASSHTHTNIVLSTQNLAFTSTNTVAANGINVRQYSIADTFSGQPSQWGFLVTVAGGDSSSENHQFFIEQSNGSIYHRGTNASSYTSPPAFKTILDSSNYTSYAAAASHNHSYLLDRTNSTASYLNYGAAGLAASAITWLCCWNGYEIRAISKAEMANAVDSSHKWVRLTGDTMTGLLKITVNSNTVTIGSQNSSWCHIYNSANIPFIFNNSVQTTSGSLGSTSYPWNNIYIGKANGAGIYYQGTKANYRMIRFIDNASDTYGNGISIGGGGQAIIGGGESADQACGQAGTAGAEIMWICNDGIIEFYPNLQNGWTSSYRNYVNTNGHFYSVAVHSAVWNDYAECRIGDTVEPGRVVTEQINGTMTTANKRLMPGCKIISDTYGMLIGETQIAKTPIAVSGRVLVYPYQPKEKYELGAAVCSAPGGTVDIMTREEIMKYPERIIGTVSEIPDYDIWYAGQRDDTSGGGAIPITVNGRIWIYVR